MAVYQIDSDWTRRPIFDTPMESVQQPVNAEHFLWISLRPWKLIDIILKEIQYWFSAGKLFLLDPSKILTPGYLPLTIRATNQFTLIPIMGN